MERELADLFAATFPRLGIEWTVGAAGGPRILGIAELERIRDALADRLAEARAEIDRRAAAEESTRALVERMIANPAEHRWVRVRGEELGERSCKHWHSQASLGSARNARRVVAGQAVLRLSLSLRVVLSARPANAITAIAPNNPDRSDGFLEVA